MVPENQTNSVYVADRLAQTSPTLDGTLRGLLRDAGLEVGVVPRTRDIWCRDYMPVQVGRGKFVQFLYDPDYLRRPQDRRTITPPQVARSLPVIKHCTRSSLRVDGGNVVGWFDKTILTDKVFVENPSVRPAALRKRLADLLRVERVIVIPQEPAGVLGHADGVVRLVNGQTVLVNDYAHAGSRELEGYGEHLSSVLEGAGLRIVPVPYRPDLRSRARIPPATGVYVNLLHTAKAVFVPVYGLGTDNDALRLLEKVFAPIAVTPVNCTTLARLGGGIHCITWSTS